MSATTTPEPQAWSGVRVLVTGATGFIGSRLVPRLTNSGADVHVVSRRRESAATGFRWHVADLTDADACDELVSTVVPDVLFHLASAVTGARDINLVRPLMMANQAAAVNLLTAVAKSAPMTRAVLTGSVEEPHPGHNLIPHSPYAAAKSATTAYARMFWALWDVRVSVLQIAMVYGPGQPDETKLVPYATQALLRGETPRLTSGTRLVDWVYVDDLVEALVRTAEADAAIGKVFDIGSGQLVSTRKVVEILASIIGGEARPQFSAVADRPMDRAWRADPQHAADMLNWRASTVLEDGLRRTVAWYAAQMTTSMAGRSHSVGAVR